MNDTPAHPVGAALPWRTLLLLFVAGLLSLGILSGRRLWQASEDNHFVYLADSYLHGTVEMRVPPPHGNDWATVETIELRNGDRYRGFWWNRAEREFWATTDEFYRFEADELRGHTTTRQHYVSFPPGPAVLMLPGVVVHDRGAPMKACQELIATLPDMLQENQLPLVIANSWNTYSKRLAQPDGTEITFPDEQSYYRFIFDRIDGLRAMIGANRPIIMLGIQPGIKDQKPIMRCFQVPTYLPNDCAAHATVPESELFNGVEFNRMAAEFAASRPNVTFLNPYHAFCTEGACRMIEGTSILYSDSVHLSKAGSDHAIRFFAAAFRTLFLAP